MIIIFNGPRLARSNGICGAGRPSSQAPYVSVGDMTVPVSFQLQRGPPVDAEMRPVAVYRRQLRNTAREEMRGEWGYSAGHAAPECNHGYRRHL